MLICSSTASSRHWVIKTRNQHTLTKIDLCLTGGRNVHSSLCYTDFPTQFSQQTAKKGKAHGFIALHTPREEKRIKADYLFTGEMREIKYEREFVSFDGGKSMCLDYLSG